VAIEEMTAPPSPMTAALIFSASWEMDIVIVRGALFGIW
jgi:hypothetical protein